ncbi:MAG: hypothetical protein AB7G21_09690 [Dehalococcoidia bacterium]
MSIELGVTAKDRITGFEGVATGFVVYISGCNQALLVAKSVDGKEGVASWFDEQRLEVNPLVEAIRLDNSKTPGFDAPPPVR